MKKTRSFTKVKMRRFLAVVFALVMVLSGISVPAVKAEADTGVNYKSILGAARYYGVLAQEFYQKNHTQTNYAVVTFRNPAGDKGMAIPNEPDLVQGNNIPFCAAHIPEGNWVRFGQSTYYKKKADPTSSKPKYLFDTQSNEGNAARISCDTNDVYLDIVEADTIAGKVNSMIAHIQEQSDSLWSKGGSAYPDEAIGDTNQFTIDVSNSGEVVYVKVTQPSSMYDTINKKGLSVKKKAEQVVVFNVEGTNVKLDKFTVEVVGSDGRTIVKNDTEASSDVGEKNDFLRDYVDEKIVWNLHEAKTVEISSGAGMFLIPKPDAKTSIIASSTGWLATAGYVENPNAEWHFPHRIIYQQGDIIPEGEDPYVRPSESSGDTPSLNSGTLKISKKDLKTLSELPGATLALYEGTYGTGVPQGTLKARWVSTDIPHPFSWSFNDDDPHYYTLYEEAAPSGYKVAANITFCIEKGVLKNVGNAYSVVKKAGTTDVTITMVDQAISSEDPDEENPDGTITYPDGGVKNPDGTITYPDGSKKNPDGTITYPDGSKKNPDGSTTTPTGTTKHPDGTVSYPDGSITKPDGTFVDSDGTVYEPDPANPPNPDADYAYDNDRVPTPDISSSDADDKDFMKEIASKSSNKKDQKNADKALKNACVIKTGSNRSVFANKKKAVPKKPGAKNTSKTSKKLNNSLKKYRKIHKKQAKQIAGWIKINGTNVNYPVMYSGLKHNDKYLHKNIYGKEDNHGMIFASYLTTSRKISYNYIIYGHNMKDETMFGNLDNYGKPSYAKSHRYINVDTSKYDYVYEVVDVVRLSCAAGSKDKMIYNKFAQINKKKVYNNWKKQVNKCRDKNYKKALGKYTNKDRLVILSTCEYTKENGRLGLICKQKKCVKVK